VNAISDELTLSAKGTDLLVICAAGALDAAASLAPRRDPTRARAVQARAFQNNASCLSQLRRPSATV
jgi:hypothetical protein